MASRLSSPRKWVAFCSVLLAAIAVEIAFTQQPAAPFGGSYSGLDARRQQLVNNWVGRFASATGQKLEPGPFYDDIVSFSAKTTFEAVTHALMTSPLTDASGAPLGDGLALIEQVDSVSGEVTGASGDWQFRMYVRLIPEARSTLTRSKEFKRGVDNSVYHKGYPVSYREQGGVPSIQISMAPDGRHADIDVDYRSSSFPVSMFNGHLSASNSDVRAGSNADRHAARWAGLQNWWRSFFGIRLDRAPGQPTSGGLSSQTPRAGKKNIEVMVDDFLKAWLVEGDVVAAMSYVSPRSYACLAQDLDDPSTLDRGTAPYQLMTRLRDAHDALGKRSSLEGLIVGVRLTTPALKVVTQPHHAQFVIYSVPDDVAAAFDCESRLVLADSKKVSRAYGHYFGATFYVNGQKDHRVALLWGREGGYWKIVSWQTGIEEGDPPAPDAAGDVQVARIKADPGFLQAGRTFLETWLVRKDYDAAFRYLSPKAYACYNLERGPDAPASTSPADAAQRLKEALARVGERVGTRRSLDEILVAAEPVHAATRVMDQPYSRTFSLTSIPDALGNAAECDARLRGESLPDPMPLEYGNAFGMTVRFKTKAGDAPVLRLLWRKEDSDWRITSYGVELP